jgi:hypothetical protein
LGSVAKYYNLYAYADESCGTPIVITSYVLDTCFNVDAVAGTATNASSFYYAYRVDPSHTLYTLNINYFSESGCAGALYTANLTYEYSNMCSSNYTVADNLDYYAYNYYDYVSNTYTAYKAEVSDSQPAYPYYGILSQ